jgi:site-specific DNA recombinase
VKADASPKSQLRFAELIRVSTDKQEKQGESLAVQRNSIQGAVDSMSGRITDRYGGQEHATAGWEKQELDRLLNDAAKKHRPFDAVIVSHPDRWSRDNAASQAGLDTLIRHGVRFFVLTSEHDLYDPQIKLLLAMHAAMGAYHAGNQTKKSAESRIKRANEGVPTGGKLPFGRIYDKTSRTWSIDPEKQAMIRDVAEQYLAGVPLPKLARDYGVNHSSLHKTLTQRCGDTWTLEFDPKGLNMAEVVSFKIPPLLPESTIRAIRARTQANKTYLHGKPKHDYLLSGYIFCAECGYAMFGQANRDKELYYRHAHKERARGCSLTHPRPWVRADVIESAVLYDLFKTLGNPAAIERATKAAAPNYERAKRKADQAMRELAKIERARNRVLDFIDHDTITDAQAELKLLDFTKREQPLRSELENLVAVLSLIPDGQPELHVLRSCGQIVVLDEDNWPGSDYGNGYLGGNDLLTWLDMMARKSNPDDRRALIKCAFATPLPDGRPPGVYVSPVRYKSQPRRFTYVIHGTLLRAQKRVTPHATC